MSNISKLFLPLGSNIPWVRPLDTNVDIYDRIKEAILLYDELYIEDGTVEAIVLRGGHFFQRYYPNDSFSGLSIYKEVISHFRIDGREINESDVIFKYKICYKYIFNYLHLKGHDFLHLNANRDKKLNDNGNINTHLGYGSLDIDSFGGSKYSRSYPPEIKHIESGEDIRKYFLYCLNIDVKEGNNLAEYNIVLENIYNDVMSAELSGSSLAVTSEHYPMFKYAFWEPAGEKEVLHHLLRVATPKFSSLSVEKIIEKRYDKLWSDFRDAIGNITHEVKDNSDITNKDINDIIKYECGRAIFEQAKRTHPTGNQLVVDLILGVTSFIPNPIVGYISTALSGVKSIKNYTDPQNKWFSFLLKLNK